MKLEGGHNWQHHQSSEPPAPSISWSFTVLSQRRRSTGLQLRLQLHNCKVRFCKYDTQRINISCLGHCYIENTVAACVPVHKATSPSERCNMWENRLVCPSHLVHTEGSKQEDHHKANSKVLPLNHPSVLYEIWWCLLLSFRSSISIEITVTMLIQVLGEQKWLHNCPLRTWDLSHHNMRFCTVSYSSLGSGPERNTVIGNMETHHRRKGCWYSQLIEKVQLQNYWTQYICVTLLSYTNHSITLAGKYSYFFVLSFQRNFHLLLPWAVAQKWIKKIWDVEVAPWM